MACVRSGEVPRWGRLNEVSRAGGEDLQDAGIGAGADDAPRRGFLSELRDAVSVRTSVMVCGVLLIQLGFILSYVGAFHAPRPVRVPIGVVAPASAGPTIAKELNRIPSDPLRAVVVQSRAAARREIEGISLSGALVISTTSKTDTLLVASAGGISVETAVKQIITEAESRLHRGVTVVDVVPLQPGDGQGLTGFYLVIGWLVGGYLVASLLGISGGSRPATFRRAAIRLLAVVPYAILSGLGGAIVVGPVLGALTGHLVALWWLGALLVMLAATVTMAFQTLFGLIGIGITVVLFVVLGNPSAGGAYQPALLPPFWRALSSALPNGAGVDSVRRIVYFGARGIAGPLVVMALYVLGGVAVTLLGSFPHERGHRQPEAA
jgi:hypothetical protein